MDYALEMFFDKSTEQKILNYFTDIKELNISSYMIDVDARPHITIGCFKDIDIIRANDVLKNYCAILENFKVKLDSIGIFTHPKACVFLAPIVTERLLELHKSLHKEFDFCSVQGFEYYLPDAWVPHCAVDISSDIDVVRRSAEYLMKSFQPFEAEITNIGWVELTKPVKRLERFELIKRGDK
ncbi:MAG: 2'-5' RNA ligase family protein [Oscillospiraceae bacterium]|nr:2'-5' RNA ligase family protein [Oscillospiraceae bacterium]